MATAMKSVSVDREAIIDAVAEITAAAEIVSELVGRQSDNEITSHLWKAAQDLREAAFGRIDAESDEAYDTDPLLVEIEARSLEIAAEVLTQHFTADLVARLRMGAELVREKKNVRANPW